MAMKRYEEGGSKALKVKPVKHRPNPAVIEAIYGLFHVSLKCVTSNQKRWMLAVDVRNPMVHSHVYGCRTVSPAVASTIMVMSLVNTEQELMVTAYAMRDMAILDINKEVGLPEILKRMRETPMGPVNCSRPLIWAKEQQKSFDVIVVCTDNPPPCGDIPTLEALQQYRQTLQLPQAKLVVCALASKSFTEPTLHEPGVLYIAGFSPEVLPLIQTFASADI
jgi:60 kDa SS-A/Ro ribonucleoprotein